MVELRRSMEQLCKVEIAGGIFVYRYPLQEPLPATTPTSLPDICLLPPTVFTPTWLEHTNAAHRSHPGYL